MVILPLFIQEVSLTFRFLHFTKYAKSYGLKWWKKCFIQIAKDEVSTIGISAAIDLIGFGRYQILLSLAVGFAFVADAMEMMILSILGPALRCTEWRISQYDQALLTTIVFLGKLFLKLFKVYVGLNIN